MLVGGKHQFQEKYPFLEATENKWFTTNAQHRSKHLPKVTVSIVSGCALSFPGYDCAPYWHGRNLEKDKRTTTGSKCDDCSTRAKCRSKNGLEPQWKCTTLGDTCKRGLTQLCYDSSCPNLKSISLCSHTVVVENGHLPEFM